MKYIFLILLCALGACTSKPTIHQEQPDEAPAFTKLDGPVEDSKGIYQAKGIRFDKKGNPILVPYNEIK